MQRRSAVPTPVNFRCEGQRIDSRLVRHRQHEHAREGGGRVLSWSCVPALSMVFRHTPMDLQCRLTTNLCQSCGVEGGIRPQILCRWENKMWRKCDTINLSYCGERLPSLFAGNGPTVPLPFEVIGVHRQYARIERRHVRVNFPPKGPLSESCRLRQREQRPGRGQPIWSLKWAPSSSPAFPTKAMRARRKGQPARAPLASRESSVLAPDI